MVAVKPIFKLSKAKAKKLQRALERELDERIQLTRCQAWIALAYGFQSYPDLLHNRSRATIVDEDLSYSEREARCRAQVESLAQHFEIDRTTAHRLITEVRPTSKRFSVNNEDSSEEQASTQNEALNAGPADK